MRSTCIAPIRSGLEGSLFKAADMSQWQGRVDSESAAVRWHQVIKAWSTIPGAEDATVLLGFACDEGVRRNHGRPGARNGPIEIRRALMNLAWHHQTPLFDSGDIICEGKQLEVAQQQLAHQVSTILQHGGRPLILGGGHEVAWGSFLGLSPQWQQSPPAQRLGIINFDAHFDLRSPVPQANSGTPFHQIARWCDQHQRRFDYMVLGLNPLANTETLFEFARQHRVTWRIDTECTHQNLAAISQALSDFLKQIDELYLTICLDVFSPHTAPGVSAPSTIGIEPQFALQLIATIKALCLQYGVVWRLSDIAEMNPTHDLNNRTARLAARLVDALL